MSVPVINQDIVDGYLDGLNAGVGEGPRRSTDSYLHGWKRAFAEQYNLNTPEPLAMLKPVQP